MTLWTGKLSVLMPAHNEAPQLFENIRETATVLAELGGDFEIIVVDDGSADETYAEAQRAANELTQVRVCKAQTNLGKGGALRVAFGEATGELVVFLDSHLDRVESRQRIASVSCHPRSQPRGLPTDRSLGPVPPSELPR